MKINEELVATLAMLSRMRLTEDEKHRYSKQLTDIVAFVEQLPNVSENDQQRIRQIAGLSNVMRADSLEGCKNVDDLLAGFPEKDGRELSVSSVL